MKLLVLAAIASAGCLAPGAYQCGDQTCPGGTVCDDTNAMNVVCLTPAQATVCKDENIAPGKPCNAEGMPGICTAAGYCEHGCGDGVTDPDEECDDGNFASHDGCSSRCLVEVPTWIEQQRPWHGLTQATAAYHNDLNNQGAERIVVIGGLDEFGPSDAIWQMDPTKFADVEQGWHNVAGAFAADARPAPRYGAAMAYDSSRNVIVLHGGFNFTADADVDETWEYAASTATFEGEPIGTWRKITSSQSPGGLFAPAMAYDASLGKVVLYGGLQPDGQTSTDTWLYDGQWTKLTTAVTPDVTFRGSMVYDPARGVTVMFGSDSDTTWEFTGTNWIELSLNPSPPPRRGAMMAFDPSRQKLVLFAGTTADGLLVLGDTWEYDGAWQEVPSPVSAPPRRTGMAVTESHNNRVLVFGGTRLNGEPPLDDVWELTTFGWEEHTPRFRPPATLYGAGAYARAAGSLFVTSGQQNAAGSSREVWSFEGITWHHEANAPVSRLGTGLVYDPDHGQLVMVGGHCGSPRTVDCGLDDMGKNTLPPVDVYALDLATRTWSKLPNPLPTAARRGRPSLVYDAHAHELVMIGGEDDVDGMLLGDAWVSDGATWTQVTSPEHPAGTLYPGAAFDPVRGVTIVFDSAGDTWQLADHAWTKLVPASDSGPRGRQSGAMTYDALRKRFVLMGGYAGDDHVFLDDVWELDPTAWELDPTQPPTWERIFVAGTSPLPRHDFVLAAHDNLRALVLHSGGGGSLFSRDDTWLLKYVSTTAEEVCTDGVDTDLDAQEDDEDPDCDPRPP